MSETLLIAKPTAGVEEELLVASPEFVVGGVLCGWINFVSENMTPSTLVSLLSIADCKKKETIIIDIHKI